MAPKPVVNLEEFRQHRPGLAPGCAGKPGDLRQRPVIVVQTPTAPQMEQQQEIGPMLFCTQVHGVGQIVANEDRHPYVGLAHAQSLGMVVLCPWRLIDSSLLVAFFAYRKARQDQDGMGCVEAQEAVLKNPEGKGVVNSKLLPVTGSRSANQHNKDRSSYF